MLKAHAINDRAHVAQLPNGDQQHQVENAFAIAPGHSCASHVLDLDIWQGGLKQSHDALGCRQSASIPKPEVNDLWRSWSIVGANR